MPVEMIPGSSTGACLRSPGVRGVVLIGDLIKASSSALNLDKVLLPPRFCKSTQLSEAESPWLLLQDHINSAASATSNKHPAINRFVDRFGDCCPAWCGRRNAKPTVVELVELSAEAWWKNANTFCISSACGCDKVMYTVLSQFPMLVPSSHKVFPLTSSLLTLAIRLIPFA